MRDRGPYAGGLIELPRHKSVEERRVLFRQAMTALAQSGTGEGPSLLDGLSPEGLAKGVRVALDGGLIDSLDWLAPEAAGAALYELASCLPSGAEQRELGRRVLSALLGADARTFVVIGKRMALGAGKGLGTPAVRARIALTVELPLAHGVADGALALALVSRQKLAREWVVQPSSGALSDRRMAARILERAAREASRRAEQGDDHAVRAFAGEAVSGAFARLLADRESLVWKHVAVARGLLAPWVTALREAVEAGASPTLTPTEWRRAATSASALIAIDPEAGSRAARAILRLREKDEGVAAALLWGMPRAFEAEPDVAGAVTGEITAKVTEPVADAFAELVGEMGILPTMEASAARVKEAAAAASESPALRDLRADLDNGPEARRTSNLDWLEAGLRDLPFRVQVARSLDAFASHGPKAAYEAAKAVLASAKSVVETLESLGEEEGQEGQAGRAARGGVLVALRDADAGLLERTVLGDLLRLGPSGDTALAHERELEELRGRMTRWIVAKESARTETSDVGLAQRRLRVLLHLVDGDVESREDAALRQRLLPATRMLQEGFASGVAPALVRANSAALARALEALVRAEAIEPVDALLAATHRVSDPARFRVLAEASMDEDLRHAFTRVEQWLAALAQPQDDQDDDRPSALDALATWCKEIVLDPSSRAEALRTALVRLHQSLSSIVGAASLRALSSNTGSRPELVTAFEDALSQIAQLSHAARARLDPELQKAPFTPPEASISLAVSRVLSGAQPTIGAAVLDLVAPTLAEIPESVAQVVASAIAKIDAMPVEQPAGAMSSLLPNEQLPSWLPARRVLGGFYVVRPLGKGGAASVFVVNRAEDRKDPHAERFALKVPDYSASAARSLSELEFLQMFRAEASALMTLPQNDNLARFVTFDTAARPKPILVMELVEGPNLEHVITARALPTARWFGVLDDVLAGLEAMHAMGVAHLDVKPSNVVLRGGAGRATEGVAVLVDFGLAGRNIRPGCATGPYGAPEVWGALAPGIVADPPKADVYAFACLAFEVLTGVVLFDGSSEIEQVGKHLAHDGFPDRLRKMAGDPMLAPLAEVLFSALRRDPMNRPTASRLRTELRRLAPTLARARWPLPT